MLFRTLYIYYFVSMTILFMTKIKSESKNSQILTWPIMIWRIFFLTKSSLSVCCMLNWDIPLLLFTTFRCSRPSCCRSARRPDDGGRGTSTSCYPRPSRKCSPAAAKSAESLRSLLKYLCIEVAPILWSEYLILHQEIKIF